MKSISKNSQGFGLVPALIALVVVLGIAGAGWYVYQQNQSSNNEEVSQSSTNSEQETNTAAEINEYIPPEGWVKYENADLELSFYYPSSWKNDDFKVESFEQFEPISSGWGTPGEYKYEVSENKWVLYLNYGTEHQKLAENQKGISTTEVDVSEYPVAYYRTGHANTTTHDILVIGNAKSFRIRLPGLNGEVLGDEWQNMVDEQSSSLEDIIQSIKFSE